MLAEIHRVLMPGKHAIVMAINRRSWMLAIQKVASVDMDYMDAPVFRRYTASEFRRMLAMFSSVRIVTERFPVRTKIHGGLKGALFNRVFVGGFNLLPRAWVRGTGHHLVAFCTKGESTLPTAA
jgi:hypothetical protein